MPTIDFEVEKGFVRYLGGKSGEFTLRWKCPTCDGGVSELVATELDIKRKQSEITKDAACHRCRKVTRTHTQKLLFTQ